MEQYTCGYCKFLINSQCENLLEHECFSSYKEELHYLNSDENDVLTIVRKQVVAKKPLETSFALSSAPSTSQLEPSLPLSQTTSWEETLIRHVQDRPALYDISLPVSQRTALKKQQIWGEISSNTGVSVENLKAKWKYLRDCYIKAKKKVNVYKPSGSAAQGPTDPGFRFYQQMKFLDDSMERQPTVSSVTLMKLPDLSPGTSSGSGLMSPEGLLSPVSKRKKTTEKNSEMEKGILQALSTPVPTPDGVDGFLIRLGESLRRLPYRERARLEIKIMQLVYDTETATGE